MDKKILRKHMLSVRNALTENEQKSYSEHIANNLFELKEYIRATNILIFINYQSEVQTSEIIEHALKMRKHVFVPRIQQNEMEFYEITSLDDCSSGYKGIMEPNESCISFSDYAIQNPLKDSDETLVLLPGLAFDHQGSRMGYGGGFYDRYLSRFTICRKVALAYDIQVIDSVPTQTHDIKTDLIITQSGVINCFI